MFGPSKQTFQIHVVELSIPMLLAESDPLQRLDKLFNLLSRMTKAKHKKTSDSSSGGGGSSTSTTPVKPHLLSPFAGSVSRPGSIPSTPLSVSGTPQGSVVTPLSTSRTPIKYTPGKTDNAFSL